jgi:hypothetical protein
MRIMAIMGVGFSAFACFIGVIILFAVLFSHDCSRIDDILKAFLLICSGIFIFPGCNGMLKRKPADIERGQQ